jgi:hypothetical protein
MSRGHLRWHFGPIGIGGERPAWMHALLTRDIGQFVRIMPTDEKDMGLALEIAIRDLLTPAILHLVERADLTKAPYVRFCCDCMATYPDQAPRWLDVALTLIEHGADGDAASESGRTLLQSAALECSPRTLRALDEVEFRADDPEWGNVAWYLLQYATSPRAVDTFKIMLDKGVDVCKKRAGGKAPYQRVDACCRTPAWKWARPKLWLSVFFAVTKRYDFTMQIAPYLR